MYEDKTLVCKECGKEFVFTAGEQEFYAERGFQNEPQRCKACRDARKNAARGPVSTSPPPAPAVAARPRCPFEPKSDRPVYCSECSVCLAAAPPTTANQGGLDARRLLDRLYPGDGGAANAPFAPQTWEALFCQQPPSLLHHPHPCHGFCALAETEVGLDAEQLGRPVRPALVKKVLSSQEYCLWQQAEDPDRLFLSLWTLKEATVKYTGDGLRGYPNHLSFDLRAPPWRVGICTSVCGMGKPCGVFMRPPPCQRNWKSEDFF